MSIEARGWEVKLLGHELNEGYTDVKPWRPTLARRVNACLTGFIASITGQEVVTSSEIRSFTLSKLMMPGAAGLCDPIGGDVAIFEDLGLLEPHVIAHEFCHRKGYLKELHAQALAYLALRNSGDPLLVQSARLERLHRQLRVLQRKSEDVLTPQVLVDRALLRKELADLMLAWLPDAGDTSVGLSRRMIDVRMRLSGQNGLSDYDEGFTNFLWTFSRSQTAQQPTHLAAV
jgi:hypothetical protein